MLTSPPKRLEAREHRVGDGLLRPSLPRRGGVVRCAFESEVGYRDAGAERPLGGGVVVAAVAKDHEEGPGAKSSSPLRSGSVTGK